MNSLYTHMSQIILCNVADYVNAVLISKYFIVALCIITSIKHLAIMMKCIVSLQNKNYGVYAKLARYAHINWERYIYKCSADI